MNLYQQIAVNLGNVLQTGTGPEEAVKVVRPVSGGSINSCYEILFREERYFLKLNRTVSFPGMFESEARALELLASSGSIEVPEIITHGAFGECQFLVLEWIERGAETDSARGLLGEKLALMHQRSSGSFGLDHNNYMGSLEQYNNFYSSVADFFVNQRLMIQVDLACDKGLLSTALRKDFDQLYRKAGEIIPPEEPALVHGDLWSGNYLVSASGIPYLIDPAVAYSHREVDMAMTTLFGGFHALFYEAYQYNFPLEKGWKKRVDFWNLYPLLVHLNLFGKGYLGEVERCLKIWL